MFGITNDDIEFIDKKLTFQLQYYEKLDINFSEGKTAKDFIYSANLNPQKYFAEINNRVNTMFLNAKEKGLMPVFCTITAPSKYHKKDIEGNLEISPNDTAKEITSIFLKFSQNNYLFEKMKKELDYSLTYFRVYEPHKSGVPHCHLMLFLPPQYILKVKKLFFRYLSSDRFGASVKALDFRYTWHNEGGGATGYIMKYILKSFKDEKTTKTNFGFNEKFGGLKT